MSVLRSRGSRRRGSRSSRGCRSTGRFSAGTRQSPGCLTSCSDSPRGPCGGVHARPPASSARTT